MVYWWITHVIQVIAQEIIEDIGIIKEVVAFHINDYKEYRFQKKQVRKLRNRMNASTSYEEWSGYSKQHDSLKDAAIWRKDPVSDSYNYEYIAHLRDELKLCRKSKNIAKIIHVLRSHAFRNIGNILNPLLYKECYIGTKNLIEEFQNEVDLCVQYIAQTSQLQLAKKMEFFIEMRHAVGRTALVLSGGGLMGMYHIGVVKILYEQNLLPRIISGSSAGSIIAAFLCCCKYEEIPELLNENGIKWEAFQKRSTRGQMVRKVKRFFNEGVLLDVGVLVEFTRDNIGDITFQEAYDRTGFVLNITVTGQDANDQDRILNYLSAPNVIIWSAVCCSCGIPYIYGPSDLLCKNEEGAIVKYLDKNKKFVDGSIGADLPMHRLSEFFNVNSFIVSQTNPWVVPIIDGEVKPSWYMVPILTLMRVANKLLTSEIKHRCQQLVDFRLLPKSLEKWLNIVLQNYEGHITIMPVPRLKDFANILEVPKSSDDFMHFMEGGSRKSFSKVPYVKAYMRYEMSLARGYAKVKTQINTMSRGSFENPSENEGCEDFEDLAGGGEEDLSMANESLFLEAFEADDDEIPMEKQKKNSHGAANSKNLYEKAKRARNFSFIIPRSQSKEVLDKLGKIGIKPNILRKNSSTLSKDSAF